MFLSSSFTLCLIIVTAPAGGQEADPRPAVISGSPLGVRVCELDRSSSARRERGPVSGPTIVFSLLPGGLNLAT